VSPSFALLKMNVQIVQGRDDVLGKYLGEGSLPFVK
jgi:hypothetical protein